MKKAHLIFVGLTSHILFAQEAGRIIPSETPRTQLGTNLGANSFLKIKQLKDQAPLTGLPLRTSQVKNYSSSQNSGLQIHDSDSNFVKIHPLFAFEKRLIQNTDLTDNDAVNAFDGGLWLEGHKENLNVYLDARIFTETHTSLSVNSWDGDFVEIQRKDQAGSSSNLDFLSYARYRANLDYTGKWGSLGFRNDNVTWGPGQINNLVFGPQAVPFSHLYYQLQIGNFRVQSLWGRVNLEGKFHGNFQLTNDTRSVYGHRYEWQISPKWLVGISEQTIIYNGDEFSSLMPVVPLFMDKGLGVEANNNGNIAFDLSYKPMQQFMLFGEFLVDDLQEPSTLFNDFWGNRWAAMGGCRGVFDLAQNELYYNLEVSRIEPWVYSHYFRNTAQATHRGIPLGNTMGPNSLVYDLFLEYRNQFKWGAGLNTRAFVKGQSFGSDAEDPVYDRKSDTKVFLDNNSKMNWVLSPRLFYKFKYLTLETSGDWDTSDKQSWYRFRIHSEY